MLAVVVVDDAEQASLSFRTEEGEVVDQSDNGT